MAEVQFFQTAMGRAFFEHTLPSLVREVSALSANVAKLTAELAVHHDLRRKALAEKTKEEAAWEQTST